jgi:tRNA threonylcarbamoyladenosine biosynthesis protein TsaB
MRILVIDTATPACSIALFDNGQLLAGGYDVIGRGHAERLIPMIADLPQLGRADQIYVNAGPGSFTGIRVGISAAKAMALAWDVPCHGYSNLQLIAAMANDNRPVDVATNGGHGEIFFQRFDDQNIPITELQSLPPATAAASSAAPVIAGDAAQSLCDLRGSGQALDILPDARQWFAISNHAPLPPSPIYGRAPDAKLPTKRPNT